MTPRSAHHTLTQAGLRGRFYAGYTEQDIDFARELIMLAMTDRKSEKFAGAGTVQRMSRFQGQMAFGQVSSNEVEAHVVKHQNGVEFEIDEWNDDATGTIRQTVSQIGRETADYEDAEILRVATENPADLLCYDGQPLYSASHVAFAGVNTPTQSNIVDMSGPAVDAAFYKTLLYTAVQAFKGFKDDRDRVLNRRLRNLRLVYPIVDERVVEEAFGIPLDNGGGTNVTYYQNRYQLQSYAESLLSSNQYAYVFLPDGMRKPLLFLDKRLDTFTHGPDSALWKDKDKAAFGVKRDFGVHPWWWQQALRIQIRP